MIVEASAPAEGPASMITLTCSPSISSACSASVAAGCPVTLADETASGPVRSSSSRASGWSGIRIATVPRESPRSHCRDGCCLPTMVSGPGQNFSISARA